MSEPFPCTPPPRRPSLATLEHCWARGLLSNEELLGSLLRYLVRQEKNQEPRTENRIHEGREGPEAENQEPRTKNRIYEGREGHEGHEDRKLRELRAQNAELTTELAQLKTQNSKLKTQNSALAGLLWQIGDTLDVLTGGELELWQAEGLWFWRWQDTGAVAPRGLRSHGEALVDAVEQRAGLLSPPEGEVG